jgi:hypothetical protein
MISLITSDQFDRITNDGFQAQKEILFLIYRFDTYVRRQYMLTSNK